VGELSTQEAALAATEATVAEQTRGGLWQRWLSAVRAHPALLAAILLFGAAVAVRLLLVSRVPTPWFGDEFVYATDARLWPPPLSVVTRLDTLQFYAYSTLIAPAWHAPTMETAYALAKAINVVLMTLGAVVVFVWGRRIAGDRLALVAAALTLLLPTQVYAGMVLTENAFFPASLLACFLIALALERPTILRQALALGGAALPAVFRAQGIVFVGVAIAAIVVYAALLAWGDRSVRSFARELWLRWFTFAAVALMALLYAGPRLVQGRSLASALGVYSGVAHAGYSPGLVARWSLNHLAELSLAVGVVPLAAFVIVLGLAVAQPASATAAQRAFLAVAFPAVAAIVIEVGAFASRFSPRIEERYVFHVQPLLLLALVVWIAQGLPRPPRLTALALSGSALLLVAIPFEGVVDAGNFSEAPGLVAISQIRDHLPLSFQDIHSAALVGALATILAFTIVPRRLWLVVPAVLGAYLLYASHLTYNAERAWALGVKIGSGATGSLTWIDDAVGRNADVRALYVNDPEPNRMIWNYLLAYTWNRSVDSVDKTAELPLCCIPQFDATYNSTTGRISGGDLDPTPEYVASNAGIAGTAVASANGLTLYKVAPPLRVATVKDGIFGDGWMGGAATITQYSTPSTRPSTMRLTLSRTSWTGGDVPGHVLIRVRRGPSPAGATDADIVDTKTWTIHAGKQREFVLRTPRPPFRVEITVDPTFSPGQFGSGDGRQLGAQVSFTPPG
jgi:hypothetical protein